MYQNHKTKTLKKELYMQEEIIEFSSNDKLKEKVERKIQSIQNEIKKRTYEISTN